MAEESEAEVIDRAKSGDPEALDALVRQIRDNVHRLATRMLPVPEAAQDATQEILIRVVTKLSTFEGKSSFNTWVHRIAVNYLLTAKKVTDREPRVTFDEFRTDLASGLVGEDALAPEDLVLLNDLRIRCTMAMLLCLDRPHRVAYVLGEVLEFDRADGSWLMVIDNPHGQRLMPSEP